MSMRPFRTWMRAASSQRLAFGGVLRHFPRRSRVISHSNAWSNTNGRLYADRWRLCWRYTNSAISSNDGDLANSGQDHYAVAEVTRGGDGETRITTRELSLQEIVREGHLTHPRDFFALSLTR